MELDPFTAPKILDSDKTLKIYKLDTKNENDWPVEEFLKFHNECFDAKMAEMKAAADEYDSDNDDSDETVAVGEMAASIKKAQRWLTSMDRG